MAMQSDGILLPKRKRVSQSKKPGATEGERDDLHFEAVANARFDWTNDEWAIAHLPFVRIALSKLHRDDVGLQSLLTDLIKDGRVPDLLDDMIRTREHLKALAKMIDIAVTRSFLVLERLGYSPENPPPTGRVN